MNTNMNMNMNMKIGSNKDIINNNIHSINYN